MIAEIQFTVEDFRRRIQAMSDEKLVQTGKAARYMADPRNSARQAQRPRCVCGSVARMSSGVGTETPQELTGCIVRRANCSPFFFGRIK